MNNKIIIGVSIVIIVSIIGITYLLRGNAANPTDIREGIADPMEGFEAKILALNEGVLDTWEIDGKKEESVTQVAEGERIFFPLIFKNYTIDESGAGEITANIAMTGPDGKEVWKFEYQNITEGIIATTTPEFLMMTNTADGDDFTPTAEMEYPSGIYKVHAEVTDTKSGKTVYLDIALEKI